MSLLWFGMMLLPNSDDLRKPVCRVPFCNQNTLVFKLNSGYVTSYWEERNNHLSSSIARLSHLSRQFVIWKASDCRLPFCLRLIMIEPGFVSRHDILVLRPEQKACAIIIWIERCCSLPLITKCQTNLSTEGNA